MDKKDNFQTRERKSRNLRLRLLYYFFTMRISLKTSSLLSLQDLHKYNL